MLLLWHGRNEIRLRLYLARRYWFESLFGLGLLLVLFGGLLVAVSQVGNSDFRTGQLDGLMVGFILWLFAITAYASSSHDVADETRARTIEQLCASPIDLWALLGIRTVIRVASGAVILLIALLVIGVVTGGRIHQNFGVVLVLAGLSAPSLMGLGYIMGGIILVAKKAETAQALTYPALIALVALPAYPINWMAVLPYSLGASAARAELSGAAVSGLTYAAIALNSAVWCCCGVLAFHFLERFAKRKGLLGHT